MLRRTIPGLILFLILLTPSVGLARHGGGHMGGGGGPVHLGGFPMPAGPTLGGGPSLGGPRHHGGVPGLAAVGGGYAAFGYFWPYEYAIGPGLYYSPPYPGAVMSPYGYDPQFGAPLPPPMVVQRPLLPPPPAQALPAPAPSTRKPSDPDRAAHLLTLGDRLFRGGNLKKAEERYQQARAAAPDRAAPHLRLAELAMVRGRYAEAASRLRDAETAEPGWLAAVPDIESIYGEPEKFLQQLSRLESFVQAHPDDRDAWLLLGAHWFLSGRTARAADVFLRLDDPNRKPDVALSAFLFASNHSPPNKTGVGQGDGPEKPPAEAH